MKKAGLILISVFLWGLNSFAQTDTVGKVKYSPDFKFNDGLYLTFQSVIENKAIPFEQIVIEGEYGEFEYIKKFVEQKNYIIVDELGNEKIIKKSSVWGFVWKGVLNVFWEKEFNRVPVIGSIAHFVANVTVYTTTPVSNPYYNNYYGRYPYEQTVASNELQQFIIDFDTGKVLSYTEKNLEIIFMREPSVYDEFMSLRKRKKKQLKFLYIRKYNQKHPLYL